MRHTSIKKDAAQFSLRKWCANKCTTIKGHSKPSAPVSPLGSCNIRCDYSHGVTRSRIVGYESESVLNYLGQQKQMTTVPWPLPGWQCHVSTLGACPIMFLNRSSCLYICRQRSLFLSLLFSIKIATLHLFHQSVIANEMPICFGLDTN